ncbi:ribonuclease HII [Spirochaetia bacterium]|nr:ribonuclease HII [Spirochaetia bacterium]
MICGIDEAGRGPLAGPVCAAAVVLPEDFDTSVLNDSKKLSAAKRESSAALIYKNALAWGLGWADHREIDDINILQATLLAMKRAFMQMIDRSSKTFSDKLICEKTFEIIVDGNRNPSIVFPLVFVCDGTDYHYNGKFECKTLVKADAKVGEVMAASILAKTARDSVMANYAKQYPQYGYEKHSGYPTKAHVEAVKKFGPSPIQRYSFKVEGQYLAAHEQGRSLFFETV